MLHCRFVIMLKMVTDNEVANFVLGFVDIKVACRIDSFKVAKFIDAEFEKRPFDLLCDLLQFYIF